MNSEDNESTEEKINEETATENEVAPDDIDSKKEVGGDPVLQSCQSAVTGVGLVFLAMAAVISVSGMFKMFEQNEQLAQNLAHLQQLRNTAQDMKSVMDGKAAQYTSSPYAGSLFCAAQVAQQAFSYVDTLKAEFSQEQIEGFFSSNTGTKVFAELSGAMKDAGELKALFDPSVEDLESNERYLDYTGADVDLFAYQAYKIAGKTKSLLSQTSNLKMVMNIASGQEYDKGLEEIDTMENQAVIIQNYSDHEGAPTPITSCFGGGSSLKF